MTRAEFMEIDAFMNGYMNESIHNRDHIYRVLYAALDVAGDDNDIDMDVLIAACLLHDVGRKAQSNDLDLNHAEVGAGIAYRYLTEKDWQEARARHVADCIRTHRFRNEGQPMSLEAKILFDADKLDAAGLMGVARTLGYGGLHGEPLYVFDEGGGLMTDGGGAEISSFLQEFNYKLRHVYDRFHTARAAEIALKVNRREAAIAFYDQLALEIRHVHDQGEAALGRVLEA